MVGDVTIGEGEFKRQYGFAGGRPGDGPKTKQRIERFTLDKLVAIAVLRQEAAKRSIAVSEESEQAMARRTIEEWGEKRYRTTIGTLNDEDFRRFLVNGEIIGRLAKALTKEQGSVPTWVKSGEAKDLPQAWKARTTCREGYESGACDG